MQAIIGKEMRNTILTAFVAVLMPMTAAAQFYTITKEAEISAKKATNAEKSAENKEVSYNDEVTGTETDTVTLQAFTLRKDGLNARKSDKRTSQNTIESIYASDLPELTIPNLYREIRRNGIRYPKIVLAQAILETGWFRSPLCRDRHNLFGLTNPRTGKYYEFDHWTESVKAYYDKVQYRYKGGNYLLWLKDIGYAEDPNYVRSVINVLKTL